MKQFVEEWKQIRILRKLLPEIIKLIENKQKVLLNDKSIVGRVKQGKLLGIAGTIDHDKHHVSYKLTLGIRKK